jgi:hypothetical protein
MNTAALPPYVLLVPLAAVAFDIYCLIDLWRTRETDRLTKAQWAAAICLFTPFGGISFLMLEKRS